MAKQKRGSKKAPKAKELEGCTKMTTKHYAERDAPPYPGTACCNQKRTGNDGQEYISKKASDGSCRWHKMKTRSQTKSSCE